MRLEAGDRSLNLKPKLKPQVLRIKSCSRILDPESCIAMSEKYFNREEAEALLPIIVDRLEQARERKQTIDLLDQELAQAAARIMMLGGSLPPYQDLAKKKAERDRFMAQVEEAVTKIQETGCVVKDLDQGLVDFPSRLEGQEIYLCWKLGEERIGYWHGIDEGFAGRKPLDDSTPDKPPQGTPRVH